MLAVCWPMSVLSWPYLKPLCWPYVDPVFAYVGRGNSLPHSSDRNDGGGNGVTTGGSAAGGASLYNLRLPPKASGKDTGVAGARI